MDSSVINSYITKINEKLNDLEKANKRVLTDTNQLLFAYRGESKDFQESKLTPSIFRNTTYIHKEGYLYELLEDYGIIKTNRDFDKMIDAQHYIAISRGLDISFNLLVSLYFSCIDIDCREEDGVIYVFAFPKYVSPHSKYLDDFYENILCEDSPMTIPDKNFKVISHSKNNKRIIAQNGGFIFFPGSNAFQLPDIYYRQVTIKAKDKEKILKELDKLFGINTAKLFPEKNYIAEHVKELFNKKRNYNNKSLTIENQVLEYINRLDYELELEKYRLLKEEKKTANDTNLRLSRIIRKEHNDLKSYIHKNNADNLLDMINREIEILRRSKLC